MIEIFVDAPMELQVLLLQMEEITIHQHQVFHLQEGEVVGLRQKLF